MTLEEAKEILAKEIQPDGSLYNGIQYIVWNFGSKYIVLDHEQFTLEKLEAIVVWIKHNGIS